MTVHIYIEPSYKGSLWCNQSLKTISDEATRKRYQTDVIDSDDIYSVDFDKIFTPDERRILLVLTTAISNSAKLTEYLAKQGVHPFYVNHQPSAYTSNYSYIIIDYSDAMRNIISYLESVNRKKICLYGINPNSSTDMIKHDYFVGYLKSRNFPDTADNIFFNYPTLDKCFHDFTIAADSFDAVICANDIVAYTLIQNLASIGKKTPDDYYIVSFGDSILSQIGAPTLTTVTTDRNEIGRQAVLIYAYLTRASESITLSAKLNSDLIIRNSTANAIPREIAKRTSFDDDTPNVNFYTNPVVNEILSVEQLLTHCDCIDLQILLGLLDSLPYTQISERLFVSENVISYRIKRLCKLIGADNKNHLIAQVKPYISPDAVIKYIEKAEQQ